MTQNVKVSEINQAAGEPSGEMYEHLEKLRDNGHPLIPRPSHDYMKRRAKGNNTDVELVTKLMADEDFQVLLVGETGVGKNHLVRSICDKTNRPMVRVNFGEGVDYSSVVGGFVPEEGKGMDDPEVRQNLYALAKEIQQEVKEGWDVEMSFGEAIEAAKKESDDFEFNYRALSQAVKHGWVFVADEINAAPPELTLPLNQVTEDKDSRHLTIPETGEVIDPHPEFKFVATMNPEYAGTKRLNDAFKNRFYTVEVDYLDAEREKALLVNRTDIRQHATDEQIDTIVDLANNIRQQSKSEAGEMNTPISPRDVIKVGKLTELMSVEEAVKMVFADGADPLDKGAIKSLIKSEQNL